MARDWFNLNNDMLRLIVGKLRTLEDFMRLGVVCSNWMNVLMKQKGLFFSRVQLPWLILPGDCKHPCQSQWRSRRSFSIMENKVHHLDFPEAYGKKCVGSSHGWLIFVEDVSPAIFMLNPLTKQRIELPPVTTMPDILSFKKEEIGREYGYRDIFEGWIDTMSVKHIERFFTHKIVLSHDPGEEDCMAVALCGQLRRLVFCRIGDNKWNKVEHELKPPQNDVVYSKGKFYVVNCDGRVGAFDVKNSQFTIIHQPPSTINICHAMYVVVDTTGALLLISRWVDIYDHGDNSEHDADNDDYNDDDDDPIYIHFYETKVFYIFKMDEEKNVWTKVRDIGENMVFLGENQSVCYSTIEFPECKKNCIYFTDDCEWKGGIVEGHDVGIFNIEDGLIKKVSCFNEDMPLKSIFPRAVWFTPSIRRK